jgi:hypothetical protein
MAACRITHKVLFRVWCIEVDERGLAAAGSSIVNTVTLPQTATFPKARLYISRRHRIGVESVLGA